VNQSGAHFAKFENSQKIEDKSYDDNFFTVVIRSTRSFWGAKKIFGVRCTLTLDQSYSLRRCFSSEGVTPLAMRMEPKLLVVS